MQAGTLLAEHLKQYLVKPLLILAIPRGGIPVAFAISEELSAAFDLVISRKIPLPYTLEAGYGAVTWNGIIVLNTELTSQLHLTEKEIQEGILNATRQVEEHSIQYRRHTALPNPQDKTVVLVDDGIASGYSMLAASQIRPVTHAKENRCCSPHSAIAISTYHLAVHR
jgi:predicted phosphoribosyltransferase